MIDTLDVEGSYLERAPDRGDRPARAARDAAARSSAASGRSAARRSAKWLPRGVLTRAGVTGRKRTGRLVACRAVRRPAMFSGSDMITVLTVDLERGLPAVDSDALMTDADTVYASADALYVATQRWFDPRRVGDEPPDGVRTAIHRFDASERGATTYTSSGEVRGFLLSQWALSEHDGLLRVASTTVPPWWGDGDGEESESFVTVLRVEDGRLAEAGRVGGLGRGEQIYAVRFIGDVGYVVTFRQVDPLYTVDLATPTAPKVLGELKIRGYSAYLHPIGEGLLLGVGQDATRQGRRSAPSSRCSTSPTRAPRRGCTSSRCPRARARSSTTTTRSSTGPRPASPCCRSSAGAGPMSSSAPRGSASTPPASPTSAVSHTR